MTMSRYAAETLGIEHRASTTRKRSVLANVQNHVLQLLCLTAMEPACPVIADACRRQAKVLRSMRRCLSDGSPGSLVLGQYARVRSTAKPVRVPQGRTYSSRSVTPTYAAMKVLH